MAPLLILLICSIWGVLGEEISQKKRQTPFGPEQQYVQERQAAPQQLPPEYLSLLRQFETQAFSGVQPQPDFQQALAADPRSPQRFVGQPPRRPPPRLSPQAQEQRRLQEAVAQKNVREQEFRDELRQQQVQLQQFYQQQGLDPQYARQLQASAVQQLQAQQAAQQQARLAAQLQEQQVAQLQGQQAAQLQAQQVAQLQAQQAAQLQAQQSAHLQAQQTTQQQQLQAVQQQYVQPQQQYVQTPQPQFVRTPVQLPQTSLHPQFVQQPGERVSYSQVRFGTTKLAPQPSLVTQPSVRPQSQPQELVYAQPQQLVYRQPQNVVYEPQLQKTAVVDQKQTPEQYLIETTRPVQQEVSIPRQRPQVYYRPQANYNDVQASVAAQQQQAQYVQQLQEATTPSPRSSIFVSTSRTPVTLKPTYARQQLEEVRLPKNDYRRPLTQVELNALVNAGFKVTPSPEQSGSEGQQPAYYRSLGKRQNKPIPRPVPLTEQERSNLARQGITNLYRVDAAESQDAPPTYVLAIGGPSRTKS
ncbi:chromatin modification-related protein eaf-1-like [Cimex lectularius]|uniref:Uncharacterized protein n=1 Tax=Cimex lectularius TaxID=79782 RepID=A0A8I6RGE2_CIMLE|nr:chromatin modification-related protein eaf-1-like [Cimex lectularius]